MLNVFADLEKPPVTNAPCHFGQTSRATEQQYTSRTKPCQAPPELPNKGNCFDKIHILAVSAAFHLNKSRMAMFAESYAGISPLLFYISAVGRHININLRSF